jgi:hypothetical protein
VKDDLFHDQDENIYTDYNESKGKAWYQELEQNRDEFTK